MKETRLRGSTGSSRILIGASLEDLASYAPPERTVLLVDTKVARLHPEILDGFRWLDAGRGERAKRLKNVERICRRLLELGADRSSLIVGVGGGVACDIAGLTASLYMRGVPFGFAPTTLLAQADAAIGGKNGVNLDGAKNVLGLFAQPAFVLVDPGVLRTLPRKEILCGAAEIIKHALIGDAALFDDLERRAKRLVALEPDVIEQAVARSIALKSAVVEADEREAGERRKLNFGHTLAHALEKSAGASHGEAVAMGMVFASRVSAARGLLPDDACRRIEGLIGEIGLPTGLGGVPARALIAAARNDKKREGGILHFVALEAIGRAVIVPLTMGELEGYFHDLR